MIPNHGVPCSSPPLLSADGVEALQNFLGALQDLETAVEREREHRPARSWASPGGGWVKDVAPPRSGSRPKGLPARQSRR